MKSTPSKSLQDVNEMFQYIVEDEFFSPAYGGLIVVKDTDDLSDEEIKSLYQEWHTFNFGV
jgi:hypothetical protein